MDFISRGTPHNTQLARPPAHRQGLRAVGHPVDVASGTFFLAWHDVEIGGAAPLVLRRYYSTSLTAESLSQFGPGWTHNFALRLAETPVGYLLRDQNGSTIEFPRSDAGPVVSILNEMSSMELRMEGGWLCVYHWHDWRTAVEKLWFRKWSSDQWRLERITSPAGVGLVLTYDDVDRLASVVQTIEGRRISFEYDEGGLISELRVWSASSAERPIATYLYDRLSRLVEVRDAMGVPIRYVYDSEGRIVREENRSGAVFRMRYDAQGRCVDTRGRNGHHGVRLQYVVASRLTLVTNSLGNVTAYRYNDIGQILEERRPNGAVSTTRYDAFGRIVEEVGPVGDSTRYEYDAASNTAFATYPSGMTMEAQYDENHQPMLLRQGQSVWRFWYEEGRLIRVVNPANLERRYGYDVRGTLIALTEPGGNTLRVLPDAGWTRARMVDDYGLHREERYNDLMHITEIVEPDGGAHHFDFDVTGRLVRATAPGSTPREYRYDGTGYLATAMDEEGHTVHLQHNEHGFLERIVTPTGRVYQCHWDTEGRLTTWVNPANERAEFKYDAAGNQIEVRHFDGRVERAEFDVAGRMVRRHLADGTAVGFDYDLSNNLLRIHSDGVDLVVNEYDTDARLLSTRSPETTVSFEYDIASRVVAEVQNGRRIEYTYNDAGALSARRLWNSPLPPVEFDWDGRLRLVSLRRGGRTVERFAHDGMDRCVERRFGGCAEIIDYRSPHQIVQTVVREGRTLVSRTWTHDRRGEVVHLVDRRSGEKRYEFDGEHRLVSSSTDAGSIEYGYDNEGNLVRWITPSEARTLEYLPGNRLTRSGARVYERDDNGRVTRIIEGDSTVALYWDALGQLVELRHSNGTRHRYAYDGFGRRLLRERNGATTEFLWSGQQLLAEVTSEQTIEYMFGEFNPTVIWQGNREFHTVNSHLGVPLEILTDWGIVVAAQRLDDWGNLARTDGDADAHTSLRFPGQYADDGTGLYYNRFRYYDPHAGQYLSPDPIGLAAGANVYVYCPNPVNWLDPYGLSCGIPPGQHSVYVLERGKRGSPGPPPVAPTPPTPPVVIYVGITRQSPHDRLSQHRAKPPGGVSPDGMRIIASGPPTVPDRTAARLLEASILTNNPVQPPGPGALNNRARPVNPGYYHSNVPSSAPPGTTHLPPSTTNPVVAPTNGTVIT